MFFMNLKKLRLVIAILILVMVFSACVNQNSLDNNENIQNIEDSSNKSDNEIDYVKRVVSKSLIERANILLDSISNIANKEMREEIEADYKKLNDSILKRNEEDVEKYLSLIEPKIEKALKDQDPNAKTEAQVKEKAIEIETSASAIEDEVVMAKAIESYNKAKEIFASGDMGKTWQALIYVEEIIKAEIITGELCLEKYNHIKSLVPEIENSELLEKANEKLKTAESLYGSGNLKDTWFELLETEQMIINKKIPEEKDSSEDINEVSNEELIIKAEELKAIIQKLEDNELKEKLSTEYIKAENAFKEGDLENVQKILIGIENVLNNRDGNVTNETQVISKEYLVEKAGKIKEMVLALEDNELKEKLSNEYIKAENAFKEGYLEEVQKILLDIERLLKE